jgi:hypothetical protein
LGSSMSGAQRNESRNPLKKNFQNRKKMEHFQRLPSGDKENIQ